MNLKSVSLLATLGALAIAAPAAYANSFTFVTPAGSTTGGGAVNAAATLTTGTGTVTITLTDLEANPTDVAQLISDIDFVLSNGATTGTVASSTGPEVTVNGDNTYTLGTSGPLTKSWNLSSSGGGIELSALGGGQPKDLIIGPPGGATYSNANGSIAGNGPHNPFVYGTGTFVVDVPGVTAATNVSSVVFSFGTTAGIDVDGVPGSVPEPSSLALGATMIGMALFLGRRFLFSNR